MRSTPPLAALLTALALLAACQSPESPTPTATIAAPTPPITSATPTTPPSATPSPPPEDYTVPEVIDEPYVQRVLTALYDLESEAAHMTFEAEEVTEDAEALMRAIHSAQVVDPLLTSFREDAAANFPGVLDPPGRQRLTLEELISTAPACVFLQADRDFSAVLVYPETQVGDTFVQLVTKPQEQVSADLNPTPWIIGGSVLRADGTRPEDPCVNL